MSVRTNAHLPCLRRIAAAATTAPTNVRTDATAANRSVQTPNLENEVRQVMPNGRMPATFKDHAICKAPNREYAAVKTMTIRAAVRRRVGSSGVLGPP